MAGKPKKDEDRRHAEKPPADHTEQRQTAAEDTTQGVPPYKD
ncbi:hypothetical protein [Bradyrhizobium sp. CCGUVB1N3]|nr:hypothetical protein [Bradyrhizobium sp. CCGUVB1N3]